MNILKKRITIDELSFDKSLISESDKKEKKIEKKIIN